MSQQYQLDYSLDSYINKLKDFGVQVSQKLQPAYFYLKNGLPYPGLLTKQKIEGDQCLVKMPIDLLLSSHVALKEPQLEQVYSNSFYKEGFIWQDRVLVTYLLFLLSTNKQSIWLHMAQQFSKHIDIVAFWQKQQIQGFVDKTIAKACKKQRDHFQKQWNRFQELQQEHPILANAQWFNKQNYKWMYIHTVSRCFGSFLNSNYFVPYCELFNHSCVDVSYICEPVKTLPTNKQEDELSEVSDYSEQYLSDDDFDYMSINSYPIKWCSKISYDLKDKQTKIIEKQLDQIYQWIDRELEWRGFTLIFLGQIIEKLKILQNQYKVGRKKYHYTSEKIEETKLLVYAYRKYLCDFYKSQGRIYQKTKNQTRSQHNSSKQLNWEHFQKSKELQNNYTHFIMQARQKATFKPYSQIYFQYGKLSNRSLLIRYGFSLQDNIYEHVWIKFSLAKLIEPYPDLFDKIQSKGLAVTYKMKIKAYTLTLYPILLMRMIKWQLTHHRLQDIFFITDLDKQIQVLEKVKQLYCQFIQKYQHIDQNLQDKQLSYHAYFVKVYNIGKKKIIKYQLNLLDYCIHLLSGFKDHSIDFKKYQISQQFQKPLKHYIKGLRGLYKI